MLKSRTACGVLAILAVLHAADRGSVAADPKPQAIADLQGGERVLTATEGPLANPLRRKEQHPWFELSNVRRRSSGFNSDGLEIDYAFEGDLHGLKVALVIVADKDRYRFDSDYAPTQRTGTFQTDKLRLSSSGSERTPNPVKFGFEIEAFVIVEELPPATISVPATHTVVLTAPLAFKVSKSVKVGKDEQITLAREWRPKEREAIELIEKRRRPPTEPPLNHVFGTQVAAFLPGTPVAAALEGEWKPAEVIWSSPDGKLFVHWNHLDHKLNGLVTAEWVAVSKDTVNRLEKEPSSFKPSANFLVGGMIPVPKDAEVVTIKTQLVPGMPLKLERGKEWVEVYLIKIDERDNLRVGVVTATFTHFTRISEEVLPRHSLVVMKSTLTELERPGSAEKFAAILKEREEQRQPKIDPNIPATIAEAQRRHALMRSPRSYAIDALLPEGTVRVTEATPLETNVKCQILWGRSWSDATVVEVLKDRVLIRWDDYGQMLEPVTRDSLVMRESALEELTAKSKAGSDDPKKTAKATTSLSTPPTANLNGDDKPATPAKGGLTLILVDVGKKKIPVAKVVMEITGFDLAEAKEILDSTPITLKKRLAPEDAQKWRKAFEAAGAKVQIEE